MHIGIDTSCYTTSIAAVDYDGIIFDKRIMLEVPQGKKGLRQSEAVFYHTRNLSTLFDEVDLSSGQSISVSARPKNVEGSYMPVFLSGVSAAKVACSALKCNYNEVSHQQGHIMAGLYSAKALHWKFRPYFVTHISGGVTEILLVNGDKIGIVGKTLDISAGQFIDRIGIKLGLKLPCAEQLEILAQHKTEDIKLPICVSGLDINFSEAESKALKLVETPENIAAAVFDCIGNSVKKVIENAQNKYNVENALIVGGVAANKQIRDCIGNKAAFASPSLSSDNAVGTALLGLDLLGGKI